MKKYLIIIFMICLSYFVQAKQINNKANKSNIAPKPPTSNYKECKNPLPIGELIINPQQYIGKEICFQGKFYSFTNIALDYTLAQKSAKDYTSLTLYRPSIMDKQYTSIPLGELKLVYPLKAIENDKEIVNLSKGDMIIIHAKVLGSWLNEPWAEIKHIQYLHNNT